MAPLFLVLFGLSTFETSAQNEREKEQQFHGLKHKYNFKVEQTPVPLEIEPDERIPKQIDKAKAKETKKRKGRRRHFGILFLRKRHRYGGPMY